MHGVSKRGTVLMVVAALAACGGDVGPTGPAGPTGPEGPEGPQGPGAVVATVEVTPGDITVSDRTRQELTATVRAEDGSVIPGVAVTWTTSDTLVAGLSPVSGGTVDPNRIMLLTPTNGSATVTATVGSVSGNATVVVDLLRYFALTGTPSPSTVFDVIDQSYNFTNNLTNSIWQRQADVIVTGHFTSPGYWAEEPMTGDRENLPDQGVDVHARMVQIPATNTVVFTRSAAANGVGLGTFDQVAVAAIDTTTGLLAPGATAVFSDGFTGSCQLTSSSGEEFLCYDGDVIRRYGTTAGSPNLTANGVLPLSVPLPAVAECDAGLACYGSTFAFDGAYYYFAAHQGQSGNLDYIVYDANGTLVNTYTAAGTGSVNGTYFDWSVGRYSTHDAYGIRGSAEAFGPGGNDTHSFGAVSSTHAIR